MSKWRPSPQGCIYVIPDIHGCADELQLILDRILPLRNNKNAKDKLIFLGDYIDRGNDSPGVLDKLIELKKKYKNQVVFLLGNHEHMMLSSLGRAAPLSTNPWDPSMHSMWVMNGGDRTIMQYAARKGIESIDARLLVQERAISFIDTNHIKFLERETVLYYELDNYVFAHAAIDPVVPLDEQENYVLLWDRSLYGYVRQVVNAKKELSWDRTIVTGHCYNGPFINSKFMMLDASQKKMLLVVELNSMEAFAAFWGNKRLVKYELKEYQPVNSVFPRVDIL